MKAMKNLFLLMTLSFLFFGATAQDTLSRRGDSVIIIKTSDSYSDAYRKIGQLLVRYNHFIKFESKDLGVINTEEYRIKGTSDPAWMVRVNVIVSGEQNATITLTSLVSHTNKSWDRVENRWGIARSVWDDMVSIAKAYDGAIVEFNK